VVRDDLADIEEVVSRWLRGSDTDTRAPQRCRRHLESIHLGTLDGDVERCEFVETCRRLLAALASACCDSLRNETLNSPLSRMRRVVRELGCTAIASMAGECETYMVVPVAHETLTAVGGGDDHDGCAMRERTRRARPYRSVASFAPRSPVTSSLRPPAMVLPGLFLGPHVG